MVKIKLNVSFFLEKDLYSQVEGIIPRSEANKIPQLNVQKEQLNNEGSKMIIEQDQQQNNNNIGIESDDQIDQDDLQNKNDNDVENQISQQGQEQDILDEELQSQQQKSMQYDDDQQQEDQQDLDITPVSKSYSMKLISNKTKRQKGDSLGLMQLPDRRPRRYNKKLDQAGQVIRREQKQLKRKQYLKKQIQAQQQATLHKILNEAGRKLKLRQVKQMQDILHKDQKQFKTLGDCSKFIITDNIRNGYQLMLNKTQLFPQEYLRTPEIKMKQNCKICNIKIGKYKVKGTNYFVCSVPCYQQIIA